jgi:hypothetical protein
MRNNPPSTFEYSEWSTFQYSAWRHGGWYIENVRYPSGAKGCVSRNYEDHKWRIVCDPRGLDASPTFKSRDEAALAEWHLVEDLKRKALDKRIIEVLRTARSVLRLFPNVTETERAYVEVDDLLTEMGREDG